MSVLGKRCNQSLSDDCENKEDFQSDSPKRKKQKASDQHILPLDNDHNAPTNIVLNVGGIKYETTIQTLTGYQSMLKARFSSKFATNPSADGTYFVDSDGQLFKYILKYLRTGMLLLPTIWTKNQIWEFYAEIKYLMVESLFDKVLLKLFDSQIVTNNLLKLKIIHKIKDTLKWNENKSINIMESLKEWKSLELMDTRIGHSLILFLIDHSIYGLFLVCYNNEMKGYYDLQKSFAFHCCENGYHLLSVQKDIDIKFSNVRKLTEEEKNDAMTEGGNGMQMTYQWIEDLHPLAIKKEIRNMTQFGGKNQTQSVVVKYAKTGYDKFKRNSRSETWSIPM
eukprot:441431_1